MKELQGLKVGFALCGSYCTYQEVLPQIQRMVDLGIEVIPLMSYESASTDTRFGKVEDYKNTITKITGHQIITTIVDAEPIGPKAFLDALIIAPCTGNTVAKIANGITDTPVLMGAKATLRNGKPVIIALATNDALGLNLKNIGILMSTKNIYFVPIGQDDWAKKPNSMVAHMEIIIPTLQEALQGKQIQPVFQSYPLPYEPL
ncbi:MAG: dipicolinate synthase subunit B [Epulopiscium sp.]|nr:dipicolinate synthase subunit B [Candidatus Epulonipiscium sp.]